MRKILTLVTLLISLVFLLLISASAEEERVYFSGDSLLTPYEILQIEDALAEAEEATGVKFRVYISSNSYYTPEGTVLSNLGVSSSDDLAVLLIEKYAGSYYYELFLYGDASKLIDYDESDLILDNSTIYSSIKSGKLKVGIEEFASFTADMLVENRQSSKTSVIVFTVIASLASGGIAVGTVVYKYKKKLKSPIYPLSKYARLSLDYQSDQFLGSTVTRTRVSSSGSGGRSGGGGGSRGRR